ncbi:MAG: hypothetical protein KAU41_02535 [Deltaproteobacteria bacterium]|nr:hypothetical protein [Deltaproteobacteria bacterium]
MAFNALIPYKGTARGLYVATAQPLDQEIEKRFRAPYRIFKLIGFICLKRRFACLDNFEFARII